MHVANVGLKMSEKAVYSSFLNYYQLFDANTLKSRGPLILYHSPQCCSYVKISGYRGIEV